MFEECKVLGSQPPLLSRPRLINTCVCMSLFLFEGYASTTRTCTDARTHARAHARTHAHKHTHTHTHARTYAHKHIHTHTRSAPSHPTTKFEVLRLHDFIHFVRETSASGCPSGDNWVKLNTFYHRPSFQTAYRSHIYEGDTRKFLDTKSGDRFLKIFV